MTDMRTQLAEKLNPGALNVSPKFTAMLAYFLGEQWTQPAIVDMAITSDDILLVGTTDDPLLDAIEGTGEDLWRNLHGVAETVGLTPEQTDALLGLARRRVMSRRRES